MTKTKPGAPVDRIRPPWVSVATRDAIRHFSWGIGDNNPLWTDEKYAAKSRWGTRIAPPCFLYAVDETTVAPNHPKHRRIYKAAHWTFYDVIHEDDRLKAQASFLGETEQKEGVAQHGVVEFRRHQGGLIARVETTCHRIMSPPPAIEDRPEVRYSGAQLEEMERLILAETRRGAESRFWEETEIGDAVGSQIKGPLSIMDVVAWSAATTGVVPSNAGHSEGGLHAQTATGPECITWISQLLTDWMGDDAFLYKLSVELEACPPLGSTTHISGAVTAKENVSENGSVQIDVKAVDQAGTRIATGTAHIMLPSTRFGAVKLPLEN